MIRNDERPLPMSDEREPILHEVADGVHAWVQPDGSWWVNNAGAIVTADGVVVVDTCATERRTRAFLTAVNRVCADAPITLAVNTHLHGDHTYGNSLLPASTVIIGHQNTRAGLLVDPVIDGCPPFWSPVPDWGNVTRRPPTLTTLTSLTVHDGDRRIEIRHPGYAAHTTGDLVVWLPDSGVLFVGDLLFHQMTPLVFMGSVEGAARVLDWIGGFEADMVVPGHGPLVDAAELLSVLETHRRYYDLVLDTARRGIRDGLSPLAAARSCELDTFAGLPDSERIVLNLHRAYADDLGIEMDLIGALSDAVALNNGPMRTSV
jgi:cyclase